MSDGDKKISGPHVTGVEREDGSVELQTTAGAISVDEFGTVKMKLDKIKSVVIGDLTEVLYHNIDSTEKVRSHHIRFANGGEVRLTYRLDGKLVEFTAERMDANITPEGIITLRSYTGED
ncbi:hypothetical protein [Methylobacterium sp. Leaf456]|uniref:hypothetical protein n=1 Tax=Methylobacterium sp. Leaf456 TaxID=1736382 RepID=UPI000AB1C2F2|nr:hypothetical protein [Methylobacterium sp. Leaf456]